VLYHAGKLVSFTYRPTKALSNEFGWNWFEQAAAATPALTALLAGQLVPVPAAGLLSSTLKVRHLCNLFSEIVFLNVCIDINGCFPLLQSFADCAVTSRSGHSNQ